MEAEQPLDATSARQGDDVVTAPEGPLRYEVVFDSLDRMVGSRILSRIVDVIGPTFPVTKGDEGPTWSVTIEFPNAEAADRFFSSDFYRQLCIDVRRSASSSVLVVPLGPADG